MKDYYNLIVELSVQQCFLKEDYADKKKLRQHDKAVIKIIKLRNEMKQCDCDEILRKLLSHEDDRVRYSAGGICLYNDVLINEAEAVLKKLMESSSYPLLRFHAELSLKLKGGRIKKLDKL